MVDTPEVESLVLEPAATPELVALSFDLWTLRLTMRFPGVVPPTYVEFGEVAGFRVLDEGDLLEFWAQGVHKPGWLWRVSRGGWRDLEATRPGFIRTDAREFLVLGINDCVSVFSGEEPKVHAPAL
ncbi:MAG: hypothetical protein K0S57_2635 [Ramlibacter sp.]|jgi:hypothetical protein|nr:hypothetical protein [Ramlibacter sp.]